VIASSSTIATLSWVVILVGILMFVVTLGPIRHSWSRRFKSTHEWFYHPDELKSETPEDSTPSPTTLLGQVEIHGWDYTMYEEHDGERAPKP
jgi:hypothetical protein